MGNYADHLSFAGANRSRIRGAYVDFLSEQGFNVGLTLNWNDTVPVQAARKQIANCFFRVDRALLGSRFNRKPELRTAGVFFFEHLGSNTHCHGLLRVNPARIDDFSALFPPQGGGVWSRVCRSGTSWLSEVTNARAAANYMLKEQHPSADDATVVWLDEFFPAAA